MSDLDKDKEEEKVSATDNSRPNSGVAQEFTTKKSVTLNSDQESPSPSLKNLGKLGFLVPFFVAFVFATILFAYFYIKDKKSNPEIGQSTVELEGPENSILKETGIQFVKKEKIYEPVKISSSNDYELLVENSKEQDFADTYEFYKIGVFNEGKYKDGELILVALMPGGPCKGVGCGESYYLRYVRKGNIVTFLPRISNLSSGDLFFRINPFRRYGLDLKVDEDFTIPILEYPKTIEGPKKRQILNFLGEKEGILNDDKLVDVFDHPRFEKVYMTKPGIGLNVGFVSDQNTRDFSEISSILNCEGESCFARNSFYVFRPDGTFLIFSYNPDLSIATIRWKQDRSSVADGDYLYHATFGCARWSLEDVSVVSPSLIDEKDLVEIGVDTKNGDSVYGLKDMNHNLLTEFYASYKNYFDSDIVKEWDLDIQLKSFEDFIKSVPVFFWKDPFGRLIRFNNSEFLPPFACEPILYLYPEYETKVSVKLRSPVKIIDSLPKYHVYNGWDVMAKPSGRLINLLDNREYPYLFWEGFSYIFPLPEEGFVVKREEMADFLPKILLDLGLNDDEKQDFLDAWLHKLKEHHYYFVGFLDQKLVDELFPLEIYPKPDTLIRVFMDFKPLDSPIKAKEPQLIKNIPKREGFVVVEWGGIVR